MISSILALNAKPYRLIGWPQATSFANQLKLLPGRCYLVRKVLASECPPHPLALTHCLSSLSLCTLLTDIYPLVYFPLRSTTLRYLINRVLSKTPYVAVIDCDVGQPEFTPSGQLSLHIFSSQKLQQPPQSVSSSSSPPCFFPLLSPPHLHLHQPELSFYLGDVTIKHTPDMFEKCVSLLFAKFLLYCDFYRVTGRIPTDPNDVTREHLEEYSNNSHFHFLSDELEEEEDNAFPLPLLVNTDGMVRGMGVEIQRYLLNLIEPSHVLHLQTDKDRILRPIEEFLKKQEGVTSEEKEKRRKTSLCLLTPGRTQASRLAAQDLRDIRSGISQYLPPPTSPSPFSILTR
jgi:hypothetical protein